jgi:hypothetical protein
MIVLGPEHSLLLIVLFDLDLVIGITKVNFREYFSTNQPVHHLINSW